MDRLEALEKRLSRERRARQEAEKLLESKSLQLFELNNALKAANDELEQRVQARTKDLERSRDDAETANRAKSQILANMSHEIRTPLNGILGMANILNDSELCAERRKQVETIRQSGNLLLSLLNDILDLSKIEAGRLELETIDFDLVALLESVSDLWSAKALAQGLSYRQELDSLSVPILTSDPTRIRQILFNLLSNALKFTAEGDIRTSVSQVRAAGKLVRTRFEVHDTGVGVAPEHLDQLFAKFAQADASVTRKHGGTGLGLAISKELAEAMGGEIGVESTAGKGSIFWFTIACPEGSPLRIVEDAGAAEPNASIRSLRILVAEDNDVNQVVIRTMLERAGHRTDVVGNGIEAVDAVVKRPYDVVLMDIQMPEMDGISATRRIRELGGSEAAIPIIALTANAMKGDRERYIDAGMNDYVSKPIDPGKMSAALTRQCGDHVQAMTGEISSQTNINGSKAESLEALLLSLDEIDRDLSSSAIDTADGFPAPEPRCPQPPDR